MELLELKDILKDCSGRMTNLGCFVFRLFSLNCSLALDPPASEAPHKF